ncbi:AAA family ATPase [bacterium]|nr:AAA family ATPase [bacterium]
MKITELFISGFGMLSKVRIEGLSCGLNIFVGDNEAGKSTLLAFIRAVFFGFETAQSRENQYKPVADVEQGGIIKLHLDHSGLDYIIKRGPGRAQGIVEVTMPDGSKGSEEVVSQLLPGVTKDLHRNVFAFSLNELQKLDSQDVRSRIYSYGAGAGDISAIDVEKQIDSEMSALFSPRTAKRKINTLLAEISSCNSHIKELSTLSTDYDSLRTQLSGINSDIERYQQQKTDLERKITHLEHMKKAWPSWESLYKAKAELSRLPDIDSFPADGIGRLERCIEKKADLSRKLNNKRSELETEKQNCPTDVYTKPVRRSPIKPAAVIAGACLVALSVAFRDNALAAAALGLLGIAAASTGFFVQSSLDASEQSRRAQLMQSHKSNLDRISCEIADIENELDQAGKEHESLLRAGGSADEENFRKRSGVYSERERIKSDITRLKADIELIAGREHAESLKSDLESTELDSIQSEHLNKHNELDRLAGDISDLTEKRGRLIQRIAEIERSEELSAALLQARTLRAQLEKHASDWAVKAICKLLMELTRQKYEREKQPRVIKSTSSFLGRFTSGAYSRVFSPLGRDEMELETPEGIRRDVSKLSRGTREQLYLALRFGLILEYGLVAEPLPVIMDDILVNFDPARSRAAAQAITELSASNQVLFFTCHPDVADMFSELGSSASRFEIRDGQIARL